MSRRPSIRDCSYLAVATQGTGDPVNDALRYATPPFETPPLVPRGGTQDGAFLGAALRMARSSGRRPGRRVPRGGAQDDAFLGVAAQTTGRIGQVATFDPALDSLGP